MLRVQKIKGSLVVVIPEQEVRKWNLSSGDILEAELKLHMKDMFGAAKGKMKPYNRKDDRWIDRE